MNAGQTATAEAFIVAIIVAAAFLFTVLRALRAARGRKPSCCSGDLGRRKKRANSADEVRVD